MEYVFTYSSQGHSSQDPDEDSLTLGEDDDVEFLTIVPSIELFQPQTKKQKTQSPEILQKQPSGDKDRPLPPPPSQQPTQQALHMLPQAPSPPIPQVFSQPVVEQPADVGMLHLRHC